MRKRFGTDQWVAWFAEFDQSHVTVAEFCRRIDVNQNSFYRWRKKLQDSHPNDAASQFVNVVVPATSQVAVEFACGAILHVDNHVDALRPVLQTLAQLGDAQQ